MIEGMFGTFVAGEDLAAHRRVKLSGATVVYADAGDEAIGVTEFAVSSGEDITVRMLNAGGTVEIFAAGTFAVSATIYGADDGKIDDVVAGQPLGKVLEAATAAGDLIETLPYPVRQGADSLIWISKAGNDTYGDGTREYPYLTITKALAAVTTSRKTIMVMPGEYTEAASLTWPSVTGISITGVGGDVTIAGTGGETQVVSINPTFSASTFEATLADLTISAPDGVKGIVFDNEHTTGRKYNLYLRNVGIDADTDTDQSLDVVHTTTTEAMRVYADGLRNIIEGLVYIAPKNTDDRFTFSNLQFDGGIQFGTATIASVSTFFNCIMKDGGGVGGQDTQILNSLGCYSLTGTTYAAAALGDFAQNAAEVIA